MLINELKKYIINFQQEPYYGKSKQHISITLQPKYNYETYSIDKGIYTRTEEMKTTTILRENAKQKKTDYVSEFE